MRFIVRWLFRLLLLAFVLALGLILAKDVLARELIASRLRAATGLETHLDRCDLGLLAPTLTLEHLRFYNPPAFGGAPFLDIAELHVEYDRTALAEGRWHLTLLRLDVAELTQVDAPDGRSNLQTILEALSARPPEKTGLQFAGIDTLNLSFGTFKRHALATPDRARVVDLRIHNAVFTHLRTARDFAPIVAQLALRFGLAGMSPPFRLPGQTGPPAAR
jgi:hypothetical protein